MTEITKVSDEIIFRLAQSLISKPESFTLKRVNEKATILEFKELFLSNLDGDIQLNLRGKDISLTPENKSTLKEAFNSALQHHSDNFLAQLDEMIW